MSNLVPISEARARLSRLVREAADDDIVLMNHGRPAAVLISAERYESLLEELEDLKDRLSVYERENITMPLDKLVAELGLVGEVELNPAASALKQEKEMLADLRRHVREAPCVDETPRRRRP